MIRVATGIIYNANHEVLVALRRPDVHLGGLWEFPGGKIEDNETVAQALTRELQEEVGITPLKTRPFKRIAYTYPDNIAIELDVWWVDEFHGNPHGREGQEVRWVKSDTLTTLEFPAACKSIVAAVKEFLSRLG